jgi:hypothetical protein
MKSQKGPEAPEHDPEGVRDLFLRKWGGDD